MQAYLIAMMFWLTENTASSAIMSVIFALSTIPQLFAGPIAGVIADRHSKKQIIICTDVIRGTSILLLALALLSDAFSNSVVVGLFAFAGVVNSVCRAFFQPAIDAWIPELVTGEKLSKTMGFFGASTQITTILGQALGGVLYRILGAPVLLLINSISYFFSAISEVFIRQDKSVESDNRHGFKSTVAVYRQDLKAGFSYVASDSGMLNILLFAAAINFFIAPIMLLLPFYVLNQLNQSAQWYGFLLAALAAGSVLGYALASNKTFSSFPRAWLMFGAMLLFATCIQILALSSLPIISLLSFMLAGVCLGVFNLNSITLFQTLTDPAMRGRVLSLVGTLSSGLLPAGALVGGLLGSLTDNDTRLIFSLAAAGIAVLTTRLCFNFRVKLFLSRESFSDVGAR